MAKFKIVILGDSRLRELDQAILQVTQHSMADIEIESFCFPGANVLQTVERGLEKIGNAHIDLIYLAAGINNLSRKVGRKAIRPAFDSHQIVDHLLTQFVNAKTRLCAKKVILCEMIGLSFRL